MKRMLRDTYFESHLLDPVSLRYPRGTTLAIRPKAFYRPPTALAQTSVISSDKMAGATIVRYRVTLKRLDGSKKTLPAISFGNRETKFSRSYL